MRERSPGRPPRAISSASWGIVSPPPGLLSGFAGYQFGKREIAQKGSKVGTAVSGGQTKTIRHTVRIPRSIPITLRIPADLLKPGEVYTVRVVAIDPGGERSEILIPFIG